MVRNVKGISFVIILALIGFSGRSLASECTNKLSVASDFGRSKLIDFCVFYMFSLDFVDVAVRKFARRCLEIPPLRKLLLDPS